MRDQRGRVGQRRSSSTDASSNKRGFQLAPIHRGRTLALLRLPLGLDHGGQVGGLVHGRPHPAAAVAKLRGHVLPFRVQLRVLRAAEVPGPFLGSPAAPGTGRRPDLVQIQGSFWGRAGGARGRRLGFTPWPKRTWRRQRGGGRRGGGVRGWRASAGRFPTASPSSPPPSLSVST